MLCKKPMTVDGLVHGCGQCMPCRINRGRLWAARIMLETQDHADNCFATLTYDPENIPENGSLRHRDVQLFLKRLRKTYARPIRYYLCGEYGTTTQRPHYHLALFGFETCRRGSTSYARRDGYCCPVCDHVRRSWGHGSVSLAMLTPESARYIAGYITKGLHKKDNPDLKGRAPEYSRMSLRPGIGGNAVHEIASVILEYNIWERNGDVPNAIRMGGRTTPLGRYLTRRLRVLVGKDPGVSQATLDKIQEELLRLRLAARDDPENPSLSSQILKENYTRSRSLEQRHEIFSSKKRTI